MSTENKTSNRFVDTPRDKPVTERTEHANLDQLSFRPMEVGAYPEGASAYGCQQMIGDAFVFDGVAHLFNFSPKNAIGRPSRKPCTTSQLSELRY